MMTMDKPSWAKALQPKGVYLSKELGIHAKPSNRAFHPTTVDARNHNNIIWTAKEGTGTELTGPRECAMQNQNWKHQFILLL